MTIMSCRYGDFSIPERDDLIFNSLREYGEWAQEELNMLGQFVHPGDTVLDVGAFIGTHTRAFSQMVGAQGIVHAFEPNKQVCCELLKNAQLASHSNIKTYQIALGRCKQSRFLLQDDLLTNLGTSQLTEDNRSADAATVDVQPLDNLNFSGIDFIKADIEGMELDLLGGGIRTICQYKPVIFLEANSLQVAGQVLDWAHGVGYVIFGHVSRAFNPDNFNRSTSNMFGEAKECGLLLIHRDQLARWQNVLSPLALPIIKTLDDLVTLLLSKPQYIFEVLTGTDVFEQLRAQLERTEQAKAIAEELAYSRLSELERLRE